MKRPQIDAGDILDALVDQAIESGASITKYESENGIVVVVANDKQMMDNMNEWVAIHKEASDRHNRV
jgi:oligoribonuclease (3'-5' exoribonuclease)